ncbi:hypothetical protein CYLTODRAFT_65758 [Cylindrobasidium torrendii FP15055 ss-10]|uniref:Uncharacterized protein n=1 Tax=Cylindrobasidium torrendii FP15055 ss-10 TaxID=1314674 RepID=A0A0D7B4C1_9AGAR|nr:hypothetical protein CYLTODRAFT_65758 [Cylindrobasidium torrendii FP15055 ss-10]
MCSGCARERGPARCVRFLCLCLQIAVDTGRVDTLGVRTPRNGSQPRTTICLETLVHPTAFSSRTSLGIVAFSLRVHGFMELSLADKWSKKFYRECPALIASGEIKYHGKKLPFSQTGEEILRVQMGENAAKRVITTNPHYTQTLHASPSRYTTRQSVSSTHSSHCPGKSNT